jgi:pimeloyl-ACP methyl ester carboxylesterase
VRIDIGDGVRLYVDVDGLGLTPVGTKLVERPTVILLHGGPGLDHASYKLGMTDLRDVAQVIVYDHRGHGRSDWRDSSEWNLDTWADDIVRLCAALEIERPIVLGNSFGGMVAQRYIDRHPSHPGKVVLSSTTAHVDRAAIAAMFEQLGGADARDAAMRFWTNPTMEHTIEYRNVCGPLYTQTPGNVFEQIETILNLELFVYWNAGEGMDFELRPGLAKAECPVLVLAGALDPVCPIVGAEEIAAALPPQYVRFERFDSCGHGVFRDDPVNSMRILREFITQ